MSSEQRGQLPFQADQLLRIELVTNLNNNPTKHCPSQSLKDFSETGNKQQWSEVSFEPI